MNDFFYSDIFTVDCDLLVIPISTEGTLSSSFSDGLEYLNIPSYVWKDKIYQLGEVSIYYSKEAQKYIAFACTVDRQTSWYFAIRMIGRSLANKVTELDGISEIASPLLGTGAGGLMPQLSLIIMRTAFYENSMVGNILLNFCTPDYNIHEYVTDNIPDVNLPSAQLVIEAEMPNIRNNEIISIIQNDDNLHFELAVNKFNEFERYNREAEVFFSNLLELFKSSNLKFKDFINSDLSEEQQEFTIICGELIAYIDYNAYYKNIWNKFKDKRVLAKSNVNQTNWFSNLLKYKINKDLNQLSPSIRAALLYLMFPESQLSMLSEIHRKKVLNELFPDEDNIEKLSLRLTFFFKSLGIKANNSKNLTTIYSRILYLPFIRPLWDDKKPHVAENYLIENESLDTVSRLIGECLRNKSIKLDIGKCGLRDLNAIPELFDCSHIEILILSNEWAVYEDGEWQPKSSVNKGKPNNLSTIPEAISKLSKLRTLICGGDWNLNKDKKNWNRWGISSLNNISKLENLEYLNVSNNELKSLTGLNKLVNLKFVHLNNNNISSTTSLQELISLEELNLSNNQIKDLNFLKYLPNLKTLDLHQNKIKDLRPIINIIERIGITNSKWHINTINIAKNPLEYPSMNFVDLGTDTVLGMFTDLRERGDYINKDIKVILVGNSEVGKSTFLKYLDGEKDMDKEHFATIWMIEKTVQSKSIVSSLGEKCNLRIFDFGGHDYYHDTHQSFYGINTLYLLLWDKETNKMGSRTARQKIDENTEVEIETQDYPLKYWLDSVKFHAKGVEADNFGFEIESGEEDYQIQLLLMQNKVADSADIQFIETTHFRKTYPFIFDNINISLLPKRNLDHFDSLFGEMLNKMDIIGQRLPKTYESVKNKISKHTGKPVLEMDEFLNYCNDTLRPGDSAFNIDECRRLISYLNQVGIVLYSKANNKEKIYINKNWLTKNMYKVLKDLKEKNGEFDRDYVIKVLDSKTEDADNLLTMMQQFKMIFKHPASDKFIAPLYLPNIPDSKVKMFLSEKQIPYRRFEFKGFIHKNVILDIFQHYATLYSLDANSDIYYFWKDALIIKYLPTEEIAMIKFHLGNEKGNACIDIYDLTKKKGHTFIDQVHEYILTVSKRYKLEEMVTLDGEDYISKAVLEKNASIGKYIFSEQRESDFSIQKEEIKYFDIKKYMEFIDKPIKTKKVVISYSKYDLRQVHTFQRYLRPLVDWDLIDEPWCCECLVTADPWDETIQNKFNEADVVFFMISANLFSTQYVLDNEIKTAIERYDEDNTSVKIVPIVLDYYNWKRKDPLNLQRFAAMPFKGKPVSDFKNPNIAWHTISEAVRIMLEHDISPEKNGNPNREIQEIYERQIEGKLDNNSN